MNFELVRSLTFCLNARQIAQEARTLIAKGENPLTSRLAQKSQLKTLENKKVTLRSFALTCIEDKQSEWSSDKHAAQWAYSLEKFAFPVIGEMALDEIDIDDIMKILTPI